MCWGKVPVRSIFLLLFGNFIIVLIFTKFIKALSDKSRPEPVEEITVNSKMEDEYCMLQSRDKNIHMIVEETFILLYKNCLANTMPLAGMLPVPAALNWSIIFALDSYPRRKHFFSELRCTFSTEIFLISSPVTMVRKTSVIIAISLSTKVSSKSGQTFASVFLNKIEVETCDCVCLYAHWVKPT